jgi:thymidylate synthase (FAD)
VVKQKVTLVAYTPNPLAVIEGAATNCYNSTPTPDGRIANQCYANGHRSVWEHVSFTFHVEGVSRALLAQLSRHRLASLTVRSQRYNNESGFQYIMPNSIEKDEGAAAEYTYLMESIQGVYDYLISLGISQEDARMVLPNACETKLEFTVNARELMLISNERLCQKAQSEIRELVAEMCRLVVEVFPEMKDKLVPKCEAHAPYCFCTERKGCGKHKNIKEVVQSGC